MPANSSTKKVNIAIIGATGRMGKLVQELAHQDLEVALDPKNADVVIDFSTPEGTEKAISMGKPLVCGTTALPEPLMQKLHLLSQKVPVLYAPNFSLGMAMTIKMLKSLMPNRDQFSVAIEETHHIHKKDAPSGTALKLGHLLKTDQITAKRQDEVVGTHKIILTLPHETITITHEALSRKVFAQGALEAAKFIFSKPAKLYTLDDIYH